LEECEIGEVPEEEHTVKTFTVPSLRLDCVAAEGFGMARTKMTELIKKGGASVNWTETDSPSDAIEEGDTISLRGHGRLVVSEIGGHSKKDRIFVTVKRYTRK
jgi:RNA-binding protein YlmH